MQRQSLVTSLTARNKIITFKDYVKAIIKVFLWKLLRIEYWKATAKTIISSYYYFFYYDEFINLNNQNYFLNYFLEYNRITKIKRTVTITRKTNSEYPSIMPLKLFCYFTNVI